MTLYFKVEEDAVVENHPEYAEFDDEGRLLLHVDEFSREEKYMALLGAALDAIEASEAYEIVEEPDVQWIPQDER